MYEVRLRSALAPTALSAGQAPWPTTRSSQVQTAGAVGNQTIALGLLLFAAVWLTHLAFASLSPPLDNIEQLTWLRSLEWGYYKHPPLPTWLIWLPAQVFGVSAWTSYVLGASLTLGSMWMLWSLLRKLRGPTHATVALLAVLCITYYNGRLYYYNHNIVLLLLLTASAALCWQAFAKRRLRWWAALGLALGLGALSKYQAAVTMVSVLVFAIQQRAWRDAVHRQGLLLAALVGLLVFSPHVAWLRTHDFGPIRYAMESSLGAGLHAPAASLHWLADQLFNRCLPALLLLVAVGFARRRNGWGKPPHLSTSTQQRFGDSRARAFLLIWGTAPLLFMTLLGLTAGVDLQLQWGTAFVLFVVPAAMELGAVFRWNEADLGRALRMFLVIQALLLLLDHLTSPRGPAVLRDLHWRAFDSAELAQDVASPARAELGGPIAVVAGPGAEAGALALQIPDRPKVLIGGQFDQSPWVSPDLVARCGVLELGPSNALPRGWPVGPAFPGLAWRVKKPLLGAAPCRK